MPGRTVIRTGGHYHLVRYAPRAGGGAHGAIFQIEDLAGHAVCHCGSSQREADQLFEALEFPSRRPRRLISSSLRAVMV